MNVFYSHLLEENTDHSTCWRSKDRHRYTCGHDNEKLLGSNRVEILHKISTTL